MRLGSEREKCETNFKSATVTASDNDINCSKSAQDNMKKKYLLVTCHLMTMMYTTPLSTEIEGFVAQRWSFARRAPSF